MSPFKKKDEHAGSGLDKPEPKSLVSRIADKLKTEPKPKAAARKPPSPKATPPCAAPAPARPRWGESVDSEGSAPARRDE